MKNQRGLQGAKRLFIVQLSLVAVLAFFVWILINARAAYSIGLGGLVWVMPQLCFAIVLFSEQRALFSKYILSHAYRREE
ncbi:MAG: ATP synthase subunit I [Legionella sp.]|nr:ATP synthase subunit I [Legionella sp.]